jgi:hypothetical protein
MILIPRPEIADHAYLIAKGSQDLVHTIELHGSLVFLKLINKVQANPGPRRQLLLGKPLPLALRTHKIAYLHAGIPPLARI